MGAELVVREKVLLVGEEFGLRLPPLGEACGADEAVPGRRWNDQPHEHDFGAWNVMTVLGDGLSYTPNLREGGLPPWNLF
jgi:hypothetical protein